MGLPIPNLRLLWGLNGKMRINCSGTQDIVVEKRDLSSLEEPTDQRQGRWVMLASIRASDECWPVPVTCKGLCCTVGLERWSQTIGRPQVIPTPHLPQRVLALWFLLIYCKWRKDRLGPCRKIKLHSQRFRQPQMRSHALAHWKYQWEAHTWVTEMQFMVAHRGQAWWEGHTSATEM